MNPDREHQPRILDLERASPEQHESITLCINRIIESYFTWVNEIEAESNTQSEQPLKFSQHLGIDTDLLRDINIAFGNINTALQLSPDFVRESYYQKKASSKDRTLRTAKNELLVVFNQWLHDRTDPNTYFTIDVLSQIGYASLREWVERNGGLGSLVADTQSDQLRAWYRDTASGYDRNMANADITRLAMEWKRGATTEDFTLAYIREHNRPLADWMEQTGNIPTFMEKIEQMLDRPKSLPVIPAELLQPIKPGRERANEEFDKVVLEELDRAFQDWQKNPSAPFDTKWIAQRPEYAQLNTWLTKYGPGRFLPLARKEIQEAFDKRGNRRLTIPEAQRMINSLRERWDNGDRGNSKAQTFTGFIRDNDDSLYQYAWRKKLLSN